jgi:nucleoside 2-deoxyribosyltransferase
MSGLSGHDTGIATRRNRELDIFLAAVWEGKLPYKKATEGPHLGPQQCDVCGSPANVKTSGAYIYEDCLRCGDFQIDREVAENFLPRLKERPLASHLIHRMQGKKRPILNPDFFTSLSQQTLPTPTEMSDNLLLTISQRVGGRPGRPISLDNANDLALAASIGAVDGEDVLWAVRNLDEQKLIKGSWLNYFTNGWLTAAGWERIENLKRAHVSSKYAFFARQFKNDDLNTLYENCLKQAVADTGYELRTVPQRAGNIDAIIEDDIRRCRFLIADLSDDNAGAYWEAGFAEGLGKDVIYICREKEKDGKTDKKTHFDTDHRQTVRWDLSKVEETAARLKAVIRNTLLGDARQED